MKITPEQGNHSITKAFKKDLIWWNKFMHKYNGVSMMYDNIEPDEVFTSDSCLTGCGGWLISSREYFKHTFSNKLLLKAKKLSKKDEIHINQLELITIMLVCKLWGHKWSGKNILAKCDNEASVEVLNKGRSHDEFMMDVIREIAFCAALHEFQLHAVHLPGNENEISDCLSRWDKIDNPDKLFKSLIGPENATEVTVTDTMTDFNYEW